MPLFTPEMLQRALTGLGVAAGQLRQIDDETRALAARFFVRAVGSGNFNAYVQKALRSLEESELDTPPARPTRVSSRPVEAQGHFIDDDEASNRPHRPRR